jgi:hypothetical protein
MVARNHAREGHSWGNRLSALLAKSAAAAELGATHTHFSRRCTVLQRPYRVVHALCAVQIASEGLKGRVIEVSLADLQKVRQAASLITSSQPASPADSSGRDWCCSFWTQTLLDYVDYTEQPPVGTGPRFLHTPCLVLEKASDRD